MADFSKMSVEELEAHRANLQETIHAARTEFVQAGKWLEKRRLEEEQSPEEVQKEIDDLQKKLTALTTDPE